MAALATVDDLEVRLGHPPVDPARAAALLDGASARVRTYTGQQFSHVVDDSQWLSVRRGRVRLPQRPVHDVSRVEGPGGHALAHEWRSGDFVTVAAPGIEQFDFEPYRTSLRQVRVTYTHGYEIVPDDVVEVVCQMTLRALGLDPSQAAVMSASIDDFSYQVGTIAAAGAVGLLPEERRALDVYRRTGGTIRVGP